MDCAALAAMLGSLRRLCPVTDVSSVHHGGAMLFVTRAATPTPPARLSDGRRTHAGVHIGRHPTQNWRLTGGNVARGGRRRERLAPPPPPPPPPRPTRRRVVLRCGAARPASACAVTRVGLVPPAAAVRGVAAITAAAAAAGTWGGRLPRGRRGCRPPPQPPPKLGARRWRVCGWGTPSVVLPVR